MSMVEAGRERQSAKRRVPDPPPRARRRRLTGRASPGHLLMVVTALAAALANVAVLRAGDERVPILVASEELPAGTPLGADVVHEVAARLDPGVLATLIQPSQLDGLQGQVTVAPIAAGAPLRRADLRPVAASQEGNRRMSVPVDPELAVGGAVRQGDRVDVIRVGGPAPGYVVSGAPVLAVGGGSGGALGNVAGFHVTIAVDPDTALCLASAIAASDVMVLLSTGQPPVPASACGAVTPPPPAAAATTAGDVPPAPAAEDGP